MKPIRNYSDGQPPIYEIITCSRCDPGEFDPDWPEFGIVESTGYYYEYETAVRALHENWCDIRDARFTAAFIEMKYPGLYPDVTPDQRTFFRWNDEKGGFYEAEEPLYLKHIGGP